MTLNDLERRNSPNRSVISLNSVALAADYIKVVEDTPMRSAAENVGQKKSSFQLDIIYGDIGRGSP